MLSRYTVTVLLALLAAVACGAVGAPPRDWACAGTALGVRVPARLAVDGSVPRTPSPCLPLNDLLSDDNITQLAGGNDSDVASVPAASTGVTPGFTPGEDASLAAAAGMAAAATPSNNNPLLSSTQPWPAWDSIMPEHIIPAVTQLVAEEAASLAALEASITTARASGGLSFELVFGPLTQIRLRLDSVYHVLDSLEYTLDSPELRRALRNATRQRVSFDARLRQSPVVYSALMALRDGGAVPALTADQRRLIERVVGDAQEGGVGLPPSTRAKLAELDSQLQQLQDEFNYNILESQASFRYWVRRQSELVVGLPPAVLEAAAANARRSGRGQGASARDGPWLFRFDGATADHVAANSPVPLMRQIFWTASVSFGSGRAFNNEPLVDKILSLRQQRASLLGYGSFGDSRLARMMASSDQVNSLLKQLTSAARFKAEVEDEAVLAHARRVTGAPELMVQLWDWPYWRSQYRRAALNLDADELRQYLVTDTVLDGAFKLFRTMFNVVITPAPWIPVWHKDVRAYLVSEAGSAVDGGLAGTPIGYIYLDLFVRPGKSSGGWTAPLFEAARYWRAASPAAPPSAGGGGSSGGGGGGGGNAGGGGVTAPTVAPQQRSKTRPEDAVAAAIDSTYIAWLRAAPKQLPSAVVVLNQQPAAGGAPALMSLVEVSYALHELGHALQHVLSETPLGLAAGWRNLEDDATEMVGMALEKFAYSKTFLATVTAHWKTGAPPPDMLLSAAVQVNRFQQGAYIADQVALTMTDWRLHSADYTPGGPVTPLAVYAEAYAAALPTRQQPPAGTDNASLRRLYNFDHIFGGWMYEAVYYAYLWSDMLAADIYAMLEAAAADGVPTLTAAGARLRRVVLAPAAATPPAAAFTALIGRPPAADAMMRYYGFAQRRLDGPGAGRR